MNAYIDSSVLLRVVLGADTALPEWRAIEKAVTSDLTEVECLRALDRRAGMGMLDSEDLADRRRQVFVFLEHMDRVGLSQAVLRRAADPFPTPLKTLDAIHLATAALWRDTRDASLVFATHDRQLATAARAIGFVTLGI